MDIRETHGLSSYIKQRLNYIINFSLHEGDDSNFTK